jgi:hypothetical protein
MSLWNAFTGASGRRRADDAYGYAQNQMNQGYEQSQGFIRDADQQARGYLSPYEQQGRNAFSQYGNMLGINGGDAQRTAMANQEAELVRVTRNTAAARDNKRETKDAQ